MQGRTTPVPTGFGRCIQAQQRTKPPSKERSLKPSSGHSEPEMVIKCTLWTFLCHLSLPRCCFEGLLAFSGNNEARLPALIVYNDESGAHFSSAQKWVSMSTAASTVVCVSAAFMLRSPAYFHCAHANWPGENSDVYARFTRLELARITAAQWCMLVSMCPYLQTGF